MFWDEPCCCLWYSYPKQHDRIHGSMTQLLGHGHHGEMRLTNTCASYSNVCASYSSANISWMIFFTQGLFLPKIFIICLQIDLKFYICFETMKIFFRLQVFLGRNGLTYFMLAAPQIRLNCYISCRSLFGIYLKWVCCLTYKKPDCFDDAFLIDASFGTYLKKICSIEHSQNFLLFFWELLFSKFIWSRLCCLTKKLRMKELTLPGHTAAEQGRHSWLHISSILFL